MISEKAIRFRHLNYNPDRAEKLFSSSMSRQLSTRNISFKSMHAFLSNLANRQTDRQTNTGKTFIIVGGNEDNKTSCRAIHDKTRRHLLVHVHSPGVAIQYCFAAVWLNDVYFIRLVSTFNPLLVHSLLLAVPNVTVHPSTASVPTS